MTDVCFLDEAEARGSALVGGKAAALAVMLAAGLPVPSGFCVTTAAYRRLAQRPQLDAELSEAIGAAYKKLGGAVAVRSSATNEDQATASFAGQMKSFLKVGDEKALFDAIRNCWHSFHGQRASVYRQRLGANDPSPAIGVVIQPLVPAVISGVLFTCDPQSADQRRMIVEASAGVASVVSGEMTPARFVLDRETGALIETASENRGDLATQGNLTADRLAELARLGRRVATLFGGERDIEWAWDGRQFWLLQARPITGASEAERAQIRSKTIAVLAAKAAATGTVWSRYNLAETLPEATPMTWAILRRLLSGRGGLGMMYRSLGFRPAPSLDDHGCYDLVCGRPYCNLSREPGMYANGLPLVHDFAALKASPARALEPRPSLNLRRCGARFWFSLPLLLLQSLRVSSALRTLSRAFPEDFQSKILPPYLADVRRFESANLAEWNGETLLQELERWIDRTLVDFASDALKPTVLAVQAVNETERLLVKRLGMERTRAYVNEAIRSARLGSEVDLPEAIQALASGSMQRSDFLRQYGHRGPREMELAEARWSESPAALEEISSSRPGIELGADTKEDLAELCAKIATEAKLSSAQAALLYRNAERARTFVALRETAKHHLMQGYSIIRRLLVELDWRYRLNGGIFYLTPEELPRLITGDDLSALISQRRRRHALELAIEVPSVIFSDDLEAIGRSSPPSASRTVYRGVPLSGGVAEGMAVVLNKAEEPMSMTGPAILVCSSTDPAWTPHLLRVRGLVTEAGGVLSHGAIIARELGLPAVSGLPRVHREIRTGQRLRVNGTAGTVEVLPESKAERSR
jgi:pyruvate,water dikinase